MSQRIGTLNLLNDFKFVSLVQKLQRLQVKKKLQGLPSLFVYKNFNFAMTYTMFMGQLSTFHLFQVLRWGVTIGHMLA